MAPDPAKLASLSAVIEHDLVAINKLDNQLSTLLEELQNVNPSFSTQAATAYLLHYLYLVSLKLP